MLHTAVMILVDFHFQNPICPRNTGSRDGRCPGSGVISSGSDVV